MRHTRRTRNTWDKAACLIAGLAVLLSAKAFQEIDKRANTFDEPALGNGSPKVSGPIGLTEEITPGMRVELGDLLGPGRLYYDEVAMAYTTALPLRVLLATLEIVAVEQPAYRYQYAGHVGEGPDAVLTLHDRETGRWLVVRQGDQLGDTTVVRVWAGTEAFEGGEAHTLYRSRVVALLAETTREREVLLRSGETLEPIPVVRIQRKDTGEILQLRPGNTLSVGEEQFVVNGINVEKESVTFAGPGDGTGLITLFLEKDPEPVLSQLNRSPER